MVNVLITGGSGYTGQFIIEHMLAQGHTVVYTHHAHPLPADAFPAALAMGVDFASGEGLDAALAAASPIHVVINCTAISQPPLCEQDYGAAVAVNVPRALVAALRRQQATSGVEALLIHFSTDQVYDGSKAMWRETDNCLPVNAYGRSKLEAEQYLAAEWPRHVCLRCSIICGPSPRVPVGRPLFLQFVQSKLAAGEATSFFEDEFRSAVWVYDICATIEHLTQLAAAGSSPAHTTYNMGGPDRLSRVDMAAAVAAHCGYSSDCIKAVPSASVSRGYCSPPDISMDVSRLQQDFPALQLTPLRKALEQLFPPAAGAAAVAPQM